jgi:metal-dependent amidase/aminoacylase/carboxypeptidase family protein
MRHHHLPGKVVIFGTPGEEGTGGGKIQLLKAGAYNGIDISLISHPGIFNNSPLVRTTAFSHIEVEYIGHAAQAANSPWLGINALDALVIAYNAVSVLRQQTMPSDVMGMHITNGGDRPNIIHPYASGACVIRAATSSRLEELQEKVTACLRAGAAATGAQAVIQHIPGYLDHVPNRLLAASYTKYWNSIPNIPDPPIPPPDRFTYVKASTDQGNLSYAMPSVNASFAIPAGPNEALRVGKGLAGMAVDVLSVPGLLSRIKEEWKLDMDDATRELC